MTPAKIVCIGLSAGGLPALIDFFRHLADSSGMAFVVVQHFPAGSVSRMASILRRVTRMPVGTAIDGQVVHGNHVYTMPPHALLAIAGGRLRLHPRDRSRARHKPIDHCMRSLAADYGADAIGIVLSGYDGDGAQGLVAIKAAGGTTYVQD